MSEMTKFIWVICFTVFPVFFLNAQWGDTISLAKIELMNYQGYATYRPSFKKKEQLIDHTNQGIIIASTLLLPKGKAVRIKAIELIFDNPPLVKNKCNTVFYFKPMILSGVNPVVNLIRERWFEVEKGYEGKYIFPIDLSIPKNAHQDYYIALETAYDNPFCPEANGYFDLIGGKKNTQLYWGKRDDMSLKNEPILKGYTLNYRLYYE